MPTENRKRGRREEKKRKREQHDADKDAKRTKREDDVEQVLQQYDDTQQHTDDAQRDFYQDEAIDGVTRPGAMPFYGMLDDDEQEYFKRADEMLELNQFADADERSMFLASVWKEADGKELKIANSQSCSRLMERLILLSTADQLKRLFQKFSSQYVCHNLIPIHFTDHAASSTSSSTALPRTAAKPSSSRLHPSSPRSLPTPTSPSRPRPTPMPSSFPWRICSCSHWPSWTNTWATS